MRRALVLRLLTALTVAGGAASAAAHDLPRRSVITAFVKVEGDALDLVLRAPLDVLGAVHFPAVGSEIDVANAAPATARALAALDHDVVLREGDARLVPSSARGRLSLPSDRSFERYGTAVAHVAEPLAAGTAVYYDQGFLDAHLRYAISSARSRFRIETLIAAELRDHVKLAVRFEAPGEGVRVMVVSSSSGTVWLNPAWYQAARGFVGLGVGHILDGIDHLLFLLCVVIPLARVRQVIAVVSAFTVAHSVTLVASAYGLAPVGPWFPPFVETAIAASIVYTAVENVAGADLRRRWVVTALFGLVHGFGFSYALRESLQFAGRHLLVALLSFNVGIELGQVLVLAVALPVLAVVRRGVLAGRAGTLVLSALVGHTGWHWLLERGGVLWRTGGPRLDAAALGALARGALFLMLAGGAAWLAARWLRPIAASAVRRRSPPPRPSPPVASPPPSTST